MPSLANEWFKQNIYYKINANAEIPQQTLYEYSGPVRDYIMGAINGGRCMTKDNKCQHIKGEKIRDFDACSLYPSSMNRMFITLGKPTQINLSNPEQIFNKDHLPKCLIYAMDIDQTIPNNDKYIANFIIDIYITNIGKQRHFPLIVKRDELNSVHYVNETDITMRVDMITLQDLIEFQDISFKILGGYYWVNCYRDLSIRNAIKLIYDKRKYYKSIGDSRQHCLKLFMNSAYGKTIQRPIKTTLTFFDNKKSFDKYLFNNWNRLHSYCELDNDKYYIEVYKSLNDQYTNCLVGETVLSMSKRIMNEVMCTGEDNDLISFYQDTDSMHIKDEDVNKLAIIFKQKYNRELIGSDMGQFHNDFPSISNKPNEDVYAISHISIGKKMYLDILENNYGEHDYMIRLKGIGDSIVKYRANELGISIEELYDKLYNGETIKFDACAIRTQMKFENNGDIHILDHYTKNIKRLQSIALDL
jgi:hypothetical protein